MSWATISNTTITADGTEQTLYNASLTGTLRAVIDCTNMASGDTLVIRLYETVNGNTRATDSWTLQGAQSPALWRPPIVSAGGEALKVTIQQTAGTNRAYGYKTMTL